MVQKFVLLPKNSLNFPLSLPVSLTLYLSLPLSFYGMEWIVVYELNTTTPHRQFRSKMLQPLPSTLATTPPTNTLLHTTKRTVYYSSMNSEKGFWWRTSGIAIPSRLSMLTSAKTSDSNYPVTQTKQNNKKTKHTDVEYDVPWFEGDGKNLLYIIKWPQQHYNYLGA